MTVNLGSATGFIELNASGVKKGADEAERAIKGFSSRMDKAGKRLSSMGGRMSLAVSAPLALIGAAASQAAIEFESSFAGVRKTVDETTLGIEGGYSALRDSILDMATDLDNATAALPNAQNELAGIMEMAGQLGVEGADNLKNFTDTIAKLTMATNLTAEAAATELARFANITQMSMENIDELGSVVVALGNSMATTEAEIVSMSQNLAAAGTQVGMTEADIMAIAAALSSVGMEAAAGGTALSRVLLEIDDGVRKSGRELETFARVAGLSSQEFAAAWEEDAAGALEMFISGLGDMQASGEDVVGVLADLGMSDVRVRDSLLRMAGAGDLLAEALGISSKAWEENVALNAEAEQRMKTTEAQINLLKNTLRGVAIVLGDALLPIINEAMGVLTPFLRRVAEGIKTFTAAHPVITRFAAVFGALLAALGPVMLMAGKVLSILATFNPIILPIAAAVLGLVWAFERLKKSNSKLAKSLKHFGARVKALAKVAGQFIQAFVKLGSVLWDMFTAFGEGADKLDPFSEKLTVFFYKISRGLAPVIGAVKGIAMLADAFATFLSITGEGSELQIFSELVHLSEMLDSLAEIDIIKKLFGDDITGEGLRLIFSGWRIKIQEGIASIHEAFGSIDLGSIFGGLAVRVNELLGNLALSLAGAFLKLGMPNWASFVLDLSGLEARVNETLDGIVPDLKGAFEHVGLPDWGTFTLDLAGLESRVNEIVSGLKFDLSAAFGGGGKPGVEEAFSEQLGFAASGSGGLAVFRDRLVAEFDKEKFDLSSIVGALKDNLKGVVELGLAAAAAIISGPVGIVIGLAKATAMAVENDFLGLGTLLEESGVKAAIEGAFGDLWADVQASIGGIFGGGGGKPGIEEAFSEQLGLSGLDAGSGGLNLDKIKETIDTVLAAINPIVDTLKTVVAESIVPALQDFGVGVKGFFDNLSTADISGMDEILGFVLKIAGAVLSVAIAVGSAVLSGLGAALPPIGAAISDFITAISQIGEGDPGLALMSIGDGLIHLADGLKSFVVGIADNLVTALGDIVGLDVPSVEEGLSAWRQVIDGLVIMVRGLGSRISKGMEFAFENMKLSLLRFVRDALAELPGVTSHMLRGLDAEIEKSEARTSAGYVMGREMASNMKAGFDSTADMRANVDMIAEGMTSAMAAHGPEAVRAFYNEMAGSSPDQATIAALNTATALALGDQATLIFQNEGRDAAQAFLDGLTEAGLGASAVTAVAEAIPTGTLETSAVFDLPAPEFELSEEELAANAAVFAGQVDQALIDAFNEAAASGDPEAKAAAQQAIMASIFEAGGDIAYLAELAAPMGQAGIDAILEGIAQGLAEQTEGVISPTFWTDQANTWETDLMAALEASSPAQKFVPAGQSIIQGVAEGVTLNTAKTVTAMTTAITAIYNAAMIATNPFVKIGEAMMDGIFLGLQQKMGDLMEAVRSIAHDALATAKEELGVASPSQAFALIGESVAAGFAAGIAHHTPMVEAAMIGMAAPPRPEMLQYGSGGGSTVTNNYSPTTNRTVNYNPQYAGEPDEEKARGEFDFFQMSGGG